MSNPPSDPVLETLRRIDGKVDAVADELKLMVVRLGTVDRVHARQFVTDIDQDAQIERLKARVDRIEKRLEISDG